MKTNSMYVLLMYLIFLHTILKSMDNQNTYLTNTSMLKISTQGFDSMPIEQLCYECDGDRCHLSRKNDPAARPAYESALHEKLMEIARNNDGLVLHAVFGSGGLKQEFIILNNFFLHYPTARVWLDCIDKEYTFLLSLMSKHNYFSLCNDVVLNHTLCTDTSLEEEHIGALHSLFIAKKMVAYFAQRYPKSSLYIKYFSSVEQYLKACAMQANPYPHIISGSDFTDQESIKNDSISHYKHLIQNVFHNNALLKNVALISKQVRDDSQYSQPCLLYITPQQ